MISLAGNRILLCGKGGSGKTTIVSLLAHVLQYKNYNIIVVNGDASNPEGLPRLIFKRKNLEVPQTLINFFGGMKSVTCPIQDPSTLTRVNDTTPLTEKKVDILKELSTNYYIEENGMYLFLAGKIEDYGQCDGPIEKVVRDFVVEGDWITLVDMKGGLEQFGRRTPDSMDIILCVLDPTFESVFIANKVASLCKEINMQNYWFILNKIDSSDLKSIIMHEMGDLKSKILGTVSYDPDLTRKQLKGDLSDSKDLYNDIEMIEKRLEVFSSTVESGWDEL